MRSEDRVQAVAGPQRECLLTEDVSEVGKFLANTEILNELYISLAASEVK